MKLKSAWATIVLLAIVAIPHGTVSAGSFSSSRGGYSSGSSYSRSYSSPSRSFSSPTYRAPSRSFSSPTYTSPSRSFSSPIYRGTPYTYRTPSTVYRAPIVEHHYYGGYGYGGSILHNPFFWMWAMQPHQTYYAQGTMMPNGVMAGDGGGYYAAPAPTYTIFDSIMLWILALAFIFFIFWLFKTFWLVLRD